MTFRKLSLALAGALSLSSSAFAQSDAATDLDDVVVTATRTATTVDQSLAPVEVIDRTDIERSQATSLPDLLRGRAGFSISNQGGSGKLTTLFLRGAESDHVLVLLDGIRMGSPTSGLFALEQLPLTMIDRIEIVRGPRSSLYGSEAIGGVIQVFTRRDGSSGLHPRATASVGSRGRAAGSAGLGGGSGRAWFGVDASYANDEGFDACEVARPTPFSGGCFIAAPEPDRDGYRNRALSLRGGLALSDALAVEAQALRAEGRNQYDGDFADLAKTVQQVVGGRIDWTPSDDFALRFTVGRDRDASHDFLHKFDPFAGAVVHRDQGWFDTDRDSAGLQADIALADAQLLTVGADWLRDRVSGSTTYAQDARRNSAGFVQYQAEFGAHALQASLRRDDNQQFGGHSTGALAWGVDLTPRWRLTAGYGTAFKAPTFNELYYPFFGNPELRPETSRSWEAGLRFHGDGIGWRVDAFSTEAEDLITFDAAINLPNNIESARMRGAELGFDAEISGWILDGSVSWLDTENREGFYAGNELPRRARHGARIALDRAFGRLRVGVTGIAEGARYDDVANTRRLPGHATLDLRAEYALTDALTLQASLDNVFDRDYQTVSFYNQPGREWLLTLRWDPPR